MRLSISSEHTQPRLDVLPRDQVQANDGSWPEPCLCQFGAQDIDSAEKWARARQVAFAPAGQVEVDLAEGAVVSDVDIPKQRIVK
eukprot:4538085-Prymnesium_polylepis.1